MAAPLGITMPAAHADCVSAEVRLWNDPDPNPIYPANIYPLYIGPKYCVAPTPFDEGGGFSNDTHIGEIPPGYPNGVGIEIWYIWPLP
jgi:hypothetical protein